MKPRTVICLLFLGFSSWSCSNTSVILDPVVNKPVSEGVTSTTQGTLTVNVTFPVSDTAHQNQVFSILLFKSGVYVAGIANDGTGTTSGTGTASVKLKALTAGNCVDNLTDATLANGTYNLYFAIRSNGDAPTAASPGGTIGCGAVGHLQYSNISSTFLTLHGTVVVNGDTTYNITNTNAVPGVQHTFSIQAGSPGSSVRCFVTDFNATTFTSTTQPLAYFTTTGAYPVTTTGAVGQTNLLPVGTYKYFCHANAGAGVTVYFDSNDMQASGTLTVSGAGTTTLNSGSFTVTLP